MAFDGDPLPGEVELPTTADANRLSMAHVDDGRPSNAISKDFAAAVAINASVSAASAGAAHDHDIEGEAAFDVPVSPAPVNPTTVHVPASAEHV